MTTFYTDPQITLRGVQQAETPTEALSRFAQLRDLVAQQRLRERESQQRLEEGNLRLQALRDVARSRASIETILRNAGGNLDAALPEIMQVDPELGLQLQKQRAEWAQLDTTGKMKLLDLENKKLETAGRLLGTVRDDATKLSAIQQAMELGLLDERRAQEYAARPYAPDWIEDIRNQALTAKEQVDVARQRLADEETRRHNLAQERLRQHQPVPGVDVPFSPEVMRQKRELAAQGSSPAVAPENKLLTPTEAAQLGVPYGTTRQQAFGQRSRTVDERTKEIARAQIEPAIAELERLSKGLITQHAASVQRALGSGMSIEAAIGNNPDYRVYQDARQALAATLAVAQQGSRITDMDVKIWLNMLPDVFRDTADSAEMKWRLARTMATLPQAGAAAKQPTSGVTQPRDERVPVNTPQGVMYFPNAQAAAAFKRKAGLK
jgi:hypothetical protein